MELTTKLIAGGVLGVCLLGAGAASWRHYSGLVDAKAELTGRVKALEQDVSRERGRADAAERAITYWAKAAEAQTRAVEDLTRAQRDAARYSKEVKDALSHHDLGALATAKPGLLQGRINAGSDRALRLLERASQAPAAPGAAAPSGGRAPGP